MESYWAHIEDNIVISVEVVSDDFVKQNPKRYSGLWLKVGEGSHRKYCSKGDIYLPDKDVIISPQLFPSWILNSNYEWEAPKPMPEGRYFWDESRLEWIEIL